MNLSVQFGTPNLVVSAPSEPYKVSAETPNVTAEFGTPEISIGFQESQLDVSTGTLIIRDAGELPPYTGDYTVTPSSEVQVLETNGKRMTDNVTVEAMPDGSVTIYPTSVFFIPGISVDGNGLITATVSNETVQIVAGVVPGYVSSVERGTVTYFGSNTNQLSTKSEITVTPSTETQTFNVKNRYMTGNVIVNPIPSNYGLISYNGSVLTVS